MILSADALEPTRDSESCQRGREIVFENVRMCHTFPRPPSSDSRLQRRTTALRAGAHRSRRIPHRLSVYPWATSFCQVQSRHRPFISSTSPCFLSCCCAVRTACFHFLPKRFPSITRSIALSHRSGWESPQCGRGKPDSCEGAVGFKDIKNCLREHRMHRPASETQTDEFILGLSNNGRKTLPGLPLIPLLDSSETRLAPRGPMSQ